MSVQSCIATLCILSACVAPPSTSVPATEPTSLVRTVTEFGGTVNVHVGNVLAVRAPMQADEWQVAFDNSILAPIGTPRDLRRPPREGWRFRAIAAGDTLLTVTPIARGGANPPRFTVTIHSDS